VARAGAVTYQFNRDGVSPTVRPYGMSRAHIEFKGANHRVFPRLAEPLPGKSNYFLGNDPSKWRVNVPEYAKLIYPQVYPGIDLVYYGTGRQLEYDFVVAPGGQPSQIRMHFSGIRSMRIDKSGDLVLKVESGELRHKLPEIYQTVGGKRVGVTGKFHLTGPREVGFEIGPYNQSASLTIDPTLQVLSYYGGSLADNGTGVAVDSTGNYYTGYTASNNFLPGQGGTSSTAGLQDVFVIKVNPAGTQTIYQTLIGGSGNDQAAGIAVDPQGNAYITGTTGSSNFPTTTGAYQRAPGGNGDAFYLKLNPAGNALVFSSLFGGSQLDRATSITLSPQGQFFLTGGTSSPNFPTMNAAVPTYMGNGDAFFAKIDVNGQPIFSSLFGTAGGDIAAKGAFDPPSGNFFFAGLIAAPTGDSDGFWASVNGTTGALLSSTRVGGSGNDYFATIQVFPGGLIMGGQTTSNNLPVTPNAPFKTRPDMSSNAAAAFIHLTDPKGNVIMTTFLPGGGVNAVLDIAPPTNSTNPFVLTVSQAGGTNNSCPGTEDHAAILFLDQKFKVADMSCLDGDVSQLFADPDGRIYFAGSIFTGGGLPVSSNAIGPIFLGGGSDAFGGVINPAGSTEFPFTSSVIYPVGQQPFDIGVGDLNGDGTPDIVVGAGSALTTFLGNGSGTFTVPGVTTQLQSPVHPTGIVTFVQQGSPSLFITDAGAPAVIGQGNAQGGLLFRPGPNLTGSLVAAGDLNGDGASDLIVADPAGQRFGFALSDGKGGFETPVFRSLPFAPSSALVGDFNGDDKPDLLVTPSAGTGVLFLSDFTNPSGPASVTLPVLRTGILPGSGVLDFTNSGVPSPPVLNLGTGLGVFSNPQSPVITVLLNKPDGPGQFTVNPAIPLFDVAGPGRGNVSEDGEIARASEEAAARAALTLPSFTNKLMAAADFDGDGNTDLAVADPYTNTVTLLKGDGKGALVPTAHYAVGQTPIAVVAADLNKDGMPDLVVLDRDSNSLHVLINQSKPPVAPLPAISAAGITNAASFLGASISPGEIVTLFGANIGPSSLVGLQLDSSGKVATTLAGVKVLFNGVAAPLIYVSAGQISAIVPYEVAGSKFAQVQVVYQGENSNVVLRPVTASKPAIFTQNSSGSGPGAILNQDFNLNTPSNPAGRGSIVQIYATGEGQTNPAGVTGLVANSVFPKPTQDVSVTIGGQPAQVAYVGAAPTLVTGVLQLNVTVPQNVTPGPAVPIVVTVGGNPSPAGVTLAVQ
jgi:uncharacterized protein (TIGR03437 family)